MKWKIVFNGRTKGAIGIMSTYVEIVEADSATDALHKLYDMGYEHIQVTKPIVEVK